MKRHLILALVSLAWGTAAWGQGSPPAATPTAGDSTQGELKFEQGEKLSDKEKLARASADLQNMRETLKVVLGKLEEARDSKDVVKLNCVNEKLTQIKGLLRIAEQAEIALEEAVAKQEPSSADHEYTKIAIANQKVAQLRAEAEQCIGQLAYGQGTSEQTKVEVTVPEDLPSAKLTTAQPPPPPTVAPPPPASPVQ